MGGKGVGRIVPSTTGEARILPRIAYRCGKQCTRRAARGGAQRTSTITPTQSCGPYFKSEKSGSASPVGGSCPVRGGPAKSGITGLEASHHAARREECLLLAQSGHRLVRCTCLLLTQADINHAWPLPECLCGLIRWPVLSLGGGNENARRRLL